MFARLDLWLFYENEKPTVSFEGSWGGEELLGRANRLVEEILMMLVMAVIQYPRILTIFTDIFQETNEIEMLFQYLVNNFDSINLMFLLKFHESCKEFWWKQISYVLPHEKIVTNLTLRSCHVADYVVRAIKGRKSNGRNLAENHKFPKYWHNHKFFKVSKAPGVSADFISSTTSLPPPKIHLNEKFFWIN